MARDKARMVRRVIIERDAAGNLRDAEGNEYNSQGELLDAQGNVVHEVEENLLVVNCRGGVGRGAGNGGAGRGAGGQGRALTLAD